MLKITAAFTSDGEIIGALLHRDSKNDATQARRTLKNETAKRLGMKVSTYETTDAVAWVEPGQMVEIDVGLDIVKD